jgi:hypothetical protein
MHYKGIVPVKTETQELIDLNHFSEPEEFSNFLSFPFFHQAKGWKKNPGSILPLFLLNNGQFIW